MKRIGFPISNTENERRRALIPSDINNIIHKEYIYVECGYGEVLGYTDNDYINAGIKVVSKEDVLKCEIICDPKIGDAEYLDTLNHQTIFGWIHAVQNRDITDKLIEKAFCDGYEYAQREFSFESKAAWLLTPGAYQAKEAAKYAYDKDEYEDKKYKYALKGLFTPGTATVMKKKAEKMAREGKSKEQIKKYLELLSIFDISVSFNSLYIFLYILLCFVPRNIIPASKNGASIANVITKPSTDSDIADPGILENAIPRTITHASAISIIADTFAIIFILYKSSFCISNSLSYIFSNFSVSTTTSPSFTVLPVLPVSLRTFFIRETSSLGRKGFGM